MILLGISALLFAGACNRQSPEPGVDPTRSESSMVVPIKLAISKEGMYQIGEPDLKKVGWTTENLANANLQLFDRNGPQPLSIIGSGDSRKITFFGRLADSLYSNENYYWLADDDYASKTELPSALAIPESDEVGSVIPDLKPPPGAYLANVALEENRVYAVTVKTRDHWYWHTLTAPMEQEIRFFINQSVPGQAGIEIDLWGSSEAAGETDHRIQVLINGILAADQAWDGQGAYQLNAVLQPGVLQDGENVITIIAPGVAGVSADVVLLDSITIYHPRRFVAEQDALDFIHPGGTLNLEGFSGPVDIYEMNQPGQATLIQQDFRGQSGFSGEAGKRYLVIGPEGYLQPELIQPAALIPDLHRQDLAVDYLVIGPAEMLPTIEPLLDLRSQQGLLSMAVPLESIYDQFSFGLPEPAGIRNLLEYGRNHWQKSPRYLLLIGDASYDPRGYFSDGSINRLPAFLVSTVYGGETGSDLGYALTGGGDWPEGDQPDLLSGIAVGRIPARDTLELQQYVEKLLEYENSLANADDLPDWMNAITAVADGSENQFKVDAEQFIDSFGDPFKVGLVAPQEGQAGANELVRSQLDAGSLLLAYFGHGSVQMWGKDQLLQVQDVAQLDDDRHPLIVLNMTCLTGLFTHPRVESLAESLLLRPQGGAMAVLAPTSLTLPNNQRFLSQAFAQSLNNSPSARLGDHFLAAQMAIPSERESAQDVLRTFLLLGDPAMNLPRLDP